MAVGVAVGVALDDIALGVALGPLFGVMLWAVEPAARRAGGNDNDDNDDEFDTPDGRKATMSDLTDSRSLRTTAARRASGGGLPRARAA